ncbi:DUF397 domain-containing protein [Streptomyces sp. NPDC086554]|uniref:DUF397 domain-containing protein n=1 Tax=Streptomyces sp. NPDC086554 TaxID=3154864 RepID=UPI0034179B4E
MAKGTEWQKSSYSGGGDAPDCVELTATAGTIHLRESETPGTELSASPGQLASFIRAVKSRTGNLAGSRGLS